MDSRIILGLLIPFFGTALGAGTVFLLRDRMGERLKKTLLGFASGVMIAASVWSLLIPAIDAAEGGALPAWLPAAGGFLLGMGFLLLLDTVTPHIHAGGSTEGPKSTLSDSMKLILAITLHNIPEGMAVGVVYAGLLAGETTLTITGALALSLGIAIQNFPEGAILSLPLRSVGYTKPRAFRTGALSGIVEPIAALITILLSEIVIPILPWLLSLSAGAMMYVVVEELIPDSQHGPHSNIGTIGMALGFVLMMILDVALG